MLTRTHKINNWNFLVKVLSIVFIFSFSNSWGQTIVSDDFENTATLFTNVGGTYYTGNSAAGDGPGSSQIGRAHV